MITSTYMKILSEKLQNSSAIIISFVTDMNQDFIKNNIQIHVLDRGMIKFLLKKRIDFGTSDLFVNTSTFGSVLDDI